jgi:zinc transporter 1/2/3
MFSLFSPLGILLGFFISSNRVLESVFLAISTGTFIYVACSEVIVEEFSLTKYKWSKFFFFIGGGGFIALLGIIDAINGGHSHSHEH